MRDPGMYREPVLTPSLGASFPHNSALLHFLILGSEAPIHPFSPVRTLRTCPGCSYPSHIWGQKTHTLNVLSAPVATPSLHAPSFLAWTVRVPPNWSQLFIRSFIQQILSSQPLCGLSLTSLPCSPTIEVPEWTFQNKFYCATPMLKNFNCPPPHHFKGSDAFYNMNSE